MADLATQADSVESSLKTRHAEMFGLLEELKQQKVSVEKTLAGAATRFELFAHLGTLNFPGEPVEGFSEDEIKEMETTQQRILELAGMILGRELTLGTLLAVKKDLRMELVKLLSENCTTVERETHRDVMKLLSSILGYNVVDDIDITGVNIPLGPGRAKGGMRIGLSEPFEAHFANEVSSLGSQVGHKDITDPAAPAAKLSGGSE